MNVFIEKTAEQIKAENIAREYIRGFFEAFKDEELLEVLKPGVSGYRIDTERVNASPLMHDYVANNIHIVEEVLIKRGLFQKFLDKNLPQEP